MTPEKGTAHALPAGEAGEAAAPAIVQVARASNGAGQSTSTAVSLAAAPSALSLAVGLVDHPVSFAPSETIAPDDGADLAPGTPIETTGESGNAALPTGKALPDELAVLVQRGAFRVSGEEGTGETDAPALRTNHSAMAAMRSLRGKRMQPASVAAAGKAPVSDPAAPVVVAKGEEGEGSAETAIAATAKKPKAKPRGTPISAAAPSAAPVRPEIATAASASAAMEVAAAEALGTPVRPVPIQGAGQPVRAEGAIPLAPAEPKTSSAVTAESPANAVSTRGLAQARTANRRAEQPVTPPAQDIKPAPVPTQTLAAPSPLPTAAPVPAAGLVTGAITPGAQDAAPAPLNAPHKGPTAAAPLATVQVAPAARTAQRVPAGAPVPAAGGAPAEMPSASAARRQGAARNLAQSAGQAGAEQTPAASAAAFNTTAEERLAPVAASLTRMQGGQRGQAVQPAPAGLDTAATMFGAADGAQPLALDGGTRAAAPQGAFGSVATAPEAREIELAALVDRLVEGRMQARADRNTIELPHPDFGRVTLALNLHGGDHVAIDLPDAPQELRQAVGQGLNHAPRDRADSSAPASYSGENPTAHDRGNTDARGSSRETKNGQSSDRAPGQAGTGVSEGPGSKDQRPSDRSRGVLA